MNEQSVCYAIKCSYVTDGVVTQCPKCGGRMRTATQVRRLGWLALLVGLVIVGAMGTITGNEAPSLLRPGVPDADGSRFTGTEQQGLLAVGGFGLLIMFGLATMANGLWQIRTGQRNKWLLYLTIALIILGFVVGGALMKALG